MVSGTNRISTRIEMHHHLRGLSHWGAQRHADKKNPSENGVSGNAPAVRCAVASDHLAAGVHPVCVRIPANSNLYDEFTNHRFGVVDEVLRWFCARVLSEYFETRFRIGSLSLWVVCIPKCISSIISVHDRDVAD